LTLIMILVVDAADPKKDLIIHLPFEGDGLLNGQLSNLIDSSKMWNSPIVISVNKNNRTLP